MKIPECITSDVTILNLLTGERHVMAGFNSLEWQVAQETPFFEDVPDLSTCPKMLSMVVDGDLYQFPVEFTGIYDMRPLLDKGVHLTIWEVKQIEVI